MPNSRRIERRHLLSSLNLGCGFCEISTRRADKRRIGDVDKSFALLLIGLLKVQAAKVILTKECGAARSRLEVCIFGRFFHFLIIILIVGFT